jgi:class 3 adenylate cyclase
MSERPLSHRVRRDEVVERFLRRSVGRGERSVAIVRVIAATLAVAAVWVANPHGVSHFEPRAWISIGGAALAMALSLVTVRSAGDVPQWKLQLSVSLDALVVLVIGLPTAIWPRVAYEGQIHMPGIYFFGLAMALSGLRLDRRLVAVSIGLNITMVLALLGLDWTINGLNPLDNVGDLVLVAGFMAGCAVMADAIASRTRTLVMEGSDSVLQAERARQALGVYVSEEIASEVLADGGDLEVGGSRRDVVVLFSDLRGFTAYSDGLEPERLVGELNDYLDSMVEVIRAEGGVVDKYIGDAIMVVFGLPLPAPDDALRAVRCAAAMQAALERHNVARVAAGLPAMRQGLGLHYGEVVAGNIGSTDRLQYTVIGATVNVASRLESATKAQGTPTLISQAVVDQLDRDDPSCPALSPHGELSLRGASKAVTVWTLG